MITLQKSKYQSKSKHYFCHIVMYGVVFVFLDGIVIRLYNYIKVKKY